MKFTVTASDWLHARASNLSFLKKFSSRPLASVGPPDGTVLIAFTSGATGSPKGVVFSNEMIAAQLNIFENTFGISAGGKDLPLLPIFALYSTAIGVCSVFPPMNPSRPLSVDAARVARIINDLGVQYSFGSPTLWAKIAEDRLRSNTVLPSMEKVFMAGAPVPLETIERVQSVLHNTAVYTPYGSTESLPVTLVDASELAGCTPEPASSGEIGTLVGNAVDGVSLRVIEATDSPIANISQTKQLPPYEIGEVIVSGANVSQQYFSRPDADAQAKIVDGDSFWHRMGDLGYLDSENRVYFCGRKVHSIRTAERVFYSVPVERIFNKHPKVRRSALIRVDGGESVGVVIEPLPSEWPTSEEQKIQFRRELAALGKQDSITESIQLFFFNPTFPVDGRHSAKIFRDKLGEWVDQQRRLGRAA